MAEYDEVWAVDAGRIRKFFADKNGDVTVISQPGKPLGTLMIPQTRIIIRGDHAEELYHDFFLHFMSAGG